MIEILIYGVIDEYSSAEFIRQMEAAKGQDVTVRVNSPGGNPEYLFGMAAKFAAHDGKKYVKVDGEAYSCGLLFICYADDVECLDVSEFLLHRAAYPSWYEQNPEWFTEAISGNLDRINKSLRKAFENKVDVAKFEELTNSKMKDIFSMDGRLDVFFDATVATKIGLVDRKTTITPKKKSELAALYEKAAQEYEKAAKHRPFRPKGNSVPDDNQEDKAQNQNDNNMKISTLAELKAAHPEVYALAIEEGAKQGVKNERDRIGAFMVYADLDIEAVKKGIASGEAMSQTQAAEFQRKAISGKQSEKIEADSTKVVKTAEQIEAEAKSAAEKTQQAEDALDKALGIKKEGVKK